MKLYSYYRSSASYRVRIALGLKGIPYEYVAVDIAPTTRDQDSAEYGEINALRQVPVLEWEDASGCLERLTQSVAIVEYLEERWPKPALFPTDMLARARVREAVEIVNSGIQPMQNTRTLMALRSAGGVELEEHFRNDAIARGLRALERLAKQQTGPFFQGDRASAADVFIVPQLYNARRFGVEIARGSRLAELEARAGAHGAFQQAHPEQQPDRARAEGRSK